MTTTTTAGRQATCRRRRRRRSVVESLVSESELRRESNRRAERCQTGRFWGGGILEQSWDMLIAERLLGDTVVQAPKDGNAALSSTATG